MNIQFDDSSQWQQGISALTLDVPRGEEDVPFTPEEMQERTVPRRTIVSSTKTTMRTSTRNINGRKVTTTVVVEEATPEDLEKAKFNNGSSEMAKEDEEPQGEEPHDGTTRGRRSLVGGVLRGITRSLSRAGSLRSLGRNKAQGSDKKKDKKKKDKKKKKEKAYFRADGKLVRRVKKKKGTEAEEPAKTDNQSDSEDHSDPEPSQDEEVEEEEETPNAASIETSPEAAPPVAAAGITITASMEQPVPLIGPSPNPNQHSIPPAEDDTPSMDFIGPALHPDFPIQYHAPKPEDTPIIGPVCGPRPCVAPAELPSPVKEEAVAFIGPLPQPQAVASKQLSTGSKSNRQCEKRALLSAALMARATASAPPSMVQRSQDLVHNPPEWKDKATAAAAEASSNKMQPDSSEGMPDWKLRAMVQRSKARASGVVPEWRERAAAAASQASTHKQTRSSFVAMAPADGIPEWKRKLLEKKRAKLLELEQAKEAGERVC